MPSLHLSRRTGRALVELLVASLLLAVGTAACLSLLRATTAFADRVIQLSAARDLTRDLAETVQADPCAADAGSETRSRTFATWHASRAGAGVTVDLVIAFPPHPFAGGVVPTFGALVAGWCA